MTTPRPAPRRRTPAAPPAPRVGSRRTAAGPAPGGAPDPRNPLDEYDDPAPSVFVPPRLEKVRRHFDDANSAPGWRGWVTPTNVLGLIALLIMIYAAIAY